jgi:hypothetical protein
MIHFHLLESGTGRVSCELLTCPLSDLSIVNL